MPRVCFKYAQAVAVRFLIVAGFYGVFHHIGKIAEFSRFVYLNFTGNVYVYLFRDVGYLRTTEFTEKGLFAAVYLKICAALGAGHFYKHGNPPYI